ncbi:hypothetical protein SDC9_165173 [bioreactor metagenome]|uniref:Uncharacterized protein n=1 Tax=bioreactor metagenome TaxID=1076179 RepID=A0A645FTN7_9ZZZZ
MYQCGKPADEVHAAFLRRAIHRLGEWNIVLRLTRIRNQRHRGDRYAFVDDRDAHLALDLLTDGDKLFRTARDFIIDLPRRLPSVAIRAVAKGDAHRDGSNVKVLTVYHVLGFKNFLSINHPAASLNAMHGVEDIFPLDADGHAEPLAFLIQHCGNVAKWYACFRDVHEHNHREHAAEDGLGDIEDVDIDSGEGDTDTCDNAHAIVADDGDDGMHDMKTPIDQKMFFQ